MQETQFPAGELEPCARCAEISMAEIGNCKEPKATMHVSRIGAKPQERYTMQNEAVALLRCPICSGSFRQEGKSLFCEKGHCYDIARQGHVNFAPNAKQSFYKKELFESRAKVFEAGVFAPVVAAIGEALEKYVKAECPVVADAGCGEGYYLRSVCPERKMIRVGFDLAKEAVLLAAKGDKQATYFVGDLANIPLADGCCDAALDVFTPANYAQFGRILKTDGVLIKLAPRAGYLHELREAAGGKLEAYDGAQVLDYAHAHVNVLEERKIAYTMPVDGELAVRLAKMTPMLANVDVDSLDLSGMKQITIDETMMIGTMKREG